MIPFSGIGMNRLSRILEAFVLVGALATIPLTVIGEANPNVMWVQPAEWAVWAIFLLEYIAMVAFTPERAVYIKRNPLNLGVIILSYPHFPTVFGLVRVARLVRFLRILRLVGVTARAVEALRVIFWRRGLVYVAAISSFIILVGGAGLTVLEPQTVRGGFGDGIWWAIVTASTVGYGDIAPTTTWGRSIAVLLMLTGVGLMSTLAASITSYFLGQEEHAALTELKERTARIENMLNRILNDRLADVGEIGREDHPAAERVGSSTHKRAKPAAAGGGQDTPAL